MRILDVQPGSGGLLVLSDRRGEELPLVPDAPFLAEVLEKEGDRVLLGLAGRLVRCETALPLEPGAQVWLTVKEAGAHRLVLAPAAPPKGQPAWPAPSAHPAQEGGFLPVEVAGLTPTFAGQEGAGPAEVTRHDLAQAVQYLLANARPTTPEAVESVAPLLAGKADLGEALLRLAALLREPEAVHLLPADLRQALAGALDQAVFQLPAETAHVPGAPAEQADALQAVLGRLGFAYEADLARTLTEAAPKAPAGSPAPPPGDVSPTGQPDTLKGLLLLVRKLLTGSPGETPSPAGVPAPAELPPPAGQEAGRPLPARLLQAVEDTIHNLTGQRLLAPANPDPATGARLEVYLQLPIAVGDCRHTAELRVYRDGHHGRARRSDGPAALTVSCRLSTSHLGPVRIDLGLRAKGATDAHLYLAGAPVAALFQAHEPELRAALESAGLKAGHIAYTVAPPSPAAPPDKSGPAGPAATGPSAIDLRL